MNTVSLNLENPIRDAISRIRFAPHSNNLLISSWDSSLRLYDVDSSKLRMEAPGEAALLDCCFENERVCFSAASDGSVNRYDLDSCMKVSVGSHDDLATCVEYSAETCQIITAGWDAKIKFWDARSTQSHGCLNSLVSEVESMSLSGINLMVAAGSSVNIYDIRSFKTSVHTRGVKVKCIRPIFNPKASQDKQFSVRNCYSLLTKQSGQWEASWPGKMLWKTQALDKVACFGWVSTRETCLTQNNQQKRGFVLCNRCYLCQEDQETVEHLFIHCRVAEQCWELFLSICGITWVVPQNVRGLLRSWQQQVTK